MRNSRHRSLVILVGTHLSVFTMVCLLSNAFAGSIGASSIVPTKNFSSTTATDNRVGGCGYTSQWNTNWSQSSATLHSNGFAYAQLCNSSVNSYAHWSSKVVLTTSVHFNSTGAKTIIASWKISYAGVTNDSGFWGCALNYSVTFSECSTAADIGLLESTYLRDANNRSYLVVGSHFSILHNATQRSFSQTVCNSSTCAHAGGNVSHLRKYYFENDNLRDKSVINASGVFAPNTQDTYELKIVLLVFADAIVRVHNAQMSGLLPVSAGWSFDANTQTTGATLLGVSIS